MKQYVVDAFTDRIFAGNPAAVCVLDAPLPDELMSLVAKENNLSETAFAVKEGDRYHLRWFTPGGEVDLCGHATLATAFVILNYCEPQSEGVRFRTMSGELSVIRKGELYEMDFPAYSLERVEVTPQMTDAIGAEPLEAYMGRDLLCVFDDEEVIRNMKPDLEKLMSLDGLLLQVTAPGKDFDCVSRSFAPKLSIPEDPVCGSAHCHIVPYWAERLGKDDILAYQASARGGTLYCRMDGERVKLAGKAVLFAESELYIG